MKSALVTFFLFSIALVSCMEGKLDTQGELRLLLDASQIESPDQIGRILFYDRTLSLDNSVSCGSCHRQAFAFADRKASSVGFANQLTPRNTPPIQNLGFSFFIREFRGPALDIFPSPQNHLFWDGRESDLVKMVVQPVTNHKEMGLRDPAEIVKKVQNKEYYQQAFKNVFQTDVIDIHMVSQSLASFVSSITTTNSPLDQHLQGTKPLTGLALQGKMLFNEKYQCNSCHVTESFGGYEFSEPFADIGLELTVKDPGVGAVTNKPEDFGKFKIPSLRNIALTAPYMHDGRFQTLDQVLNHYSEGILPSKNLDVRLHTLLNETKSRSFTPEEKQALLAFMHSLTDYSLVTNTAFSDPFYSK